MQWKIEQKYSFSEKSVTVLEEKSSNEDWLRTFGWKSCLLVMPGSLTRWSTPAKDKFIQDNVTLTSLTKNLSGLKISSFIPIFAGGGPGAASGLNLHQADSSTSTIEGFPPHFLSFSLGHQFQPSGHQSHGNLKNH